MLLVSGYPNVKSAMEAILLQGDDRVVKPFELGKLAGLVQEKLLIRKPTARMQKERGAAILQRCTSDIVEDWLRRVKKNKLLNHVVLTDKQRTGYLPNLLGDLLVRLRDSDVAGEESGSVCSAAATAHGKMRKELGYTPGMLVHDSQMLQVTLFAEVADQL